MSDALIVRRRRGSGTVQIRCSLRDLQVARGVLFSDLSLQRPFHGLDLFFGQWRQQLSFHAVALMSDTVCCDGEIGQVRIEHLAGGIVQDSKKK